MSIHDFKTFDGAVERSLRPHGADPAVSGASGTIRVLPLKKAQ